MLNRLVVADDDTNVRTMRRNMDEFAVVEAANELRSAGKTFQA